MGESTDFNFNGDYRAIVEENEDPLELGRVRVRIIGLHSLDVEETPVENLPWAEPALSLYYSGGKNLLATKEKTGPRYIANGEKSDIPKRTTEEFKEKFVDEILKGQGSGAIFTTPRKGTLVWIFFDGGNHMRPIYWGSAVKASDWREQRKKLDKDIKTKKDEIIDIKSKFTPDTKTYKGASCSDEASVSTKINKPKLQITDLNNIKNAHITSFTSPGGVTYIIVNEEDKEKTYIIHKGHLEYTDEKGQRKIVDGLTQGKANDLEHTVANNFELHIGGDFDVYVQKSHFIQVDGDAQINVKGNIGMRSGKDVDIIAEGNINLDSKKNVNINAANSLQYHASKMLGKIDSNYDLTVGGECNIAVSLSAKIKSLDLHLKSITNQIFETGNQQTNISTIHLAKASSFYSIQSDAIVRINAGASLQTTSAAIDLAGTAVNVGGAVMLGSATAQAAPQITPPTTDAEAVASKKTFQKSNTPKSITENPSNS